MTLKSPCSGPSSAPVFLGSPSSASRCPVCFLAQLQRCMTDKKYRKCQMTAATTNVFTSSDQKGRGLHRAPSPVTLVTPGRTTHPSRPSNRAALHTTSVAAVLLFEKKHFLCLNRSWLRCGSKITKLASGWGALFSSAGVT